MKEMTIFHIIEAQPYHCGQMARILRDEHLAAMPHLGRIQIHRALRSAFDASAYRRAWTIDGRLAGLGGVTGTLMNRQGRIWLALSQEATRHPVAVTREAARQISHLWEGYEGLTTNLLASDFTARRFAGWLGFREGAAPEAQCLFSAAANREAA